VTERAPGTYASALLGCLVTVTVDRPIGSRHPRYGFEYPVNYGYIPGTRAPDGDETDAYVLGVAERIETFRGRAVALIRRDGDDDDKLIVVPDGETVTDAQIEEATAFQERWLRYSIIRAG
jgi:inorganic pyrophosphatase